MENKLPRGWVECILKDILTLKNGYAFKSTDYNETGIPLIRISDIADGKVNATNSVRIPMEKVNDGYYVEKGDILIAMSGATTGKFGIYNGKEQCLQNQRVGNFKLHSDKLFNKRFLYYLITDLQKKIEESAYGGAQPNISSTKIEELTVVIPPLKEQRRITEKLDAILAKVNNSKARLDKIPAILKSFRKSVLAAAVSGELTKGWREQRGSMVDLDWLLALIFKDLKTKISFEDLENVEYPVSWKVVQLGRLSKLVTKGASPNWQGIEYTSKGVLFITSENVGNGKLLLRTKKFLEEDFNKIQKRSILQKGDLLTNIVGASIGRTAIFNLNEKANINQAVCLIRLHETLNKEFYCLVMNSPQIIAIMHKEKVDVARANISLNDVNNFPVPLPSLEEQEEIVRKVNELFHLADIIEIRYQKSIAWFDKVSQAILAKAFRGELVEQDENDEPANVLLERIKQEKEASVTKSKKPTSKKRTKSIRA